MHCHRLHHERGAMQGVFDMRTRIWRYADRARMHQNRDRWNEDRVRVGFFRYGPDEHHADYGRDLDQPGQPGSSCSDVGRYGYVHDGSRDMNYPMEAGYDAGYDRSADLGYVGASAMADMAVITGAACGPIMSATVPSARMTASAGSDSRILEDVSDSPSDDDLVDASEIDVGVENGDVTLSGTVDSRAAKRGAEDCIAEISDVRHVQNNLWVDMPSGPGQIGQSAGGTR